MRYYEVKAEKALCPTQIDLADFVINPYKGCGVGCAYCYSRSNKGLKKIGEEWGDFVHIKRNLPELLEKELAEYQGPKIRRIMIGSTTEAFQDAEEKYGITGSVLEILSRHQIPVVILSKSNLIQGQLHQLSYSRDNLIYFTYNSEAVRALFEKRSFPEADRLSAIENIYRSGIGLKVYISPVFPFLTEPLSIFEALKGKTGSVQFEAYSMRMGNWGDVQGRLDEETVRKYLDIYHSKETYDSYWNDFVKNTEILNREYQYSLKFYIEPFNSFYGGKKYSV